MYILVHLLSFQDRISQSKGRRNKQIHPHTHIQTRLNMFATSIGINCPRLTNLSIHFVAATLSRQDGINSKSSYENNFGYARNNEKIRYCIYDYAQLFFGEDFYSPDLRRLSTPIPEFFL